MFVRGGGGQPETETPGWCRSERRDRSVELNAILTRLECNVGDLAADLTATEDEPSGDGHEPDARYWRGLTISGSRERRLTSALLLVLPDVEPT
jgi:hypothetical protein